MNDKPEVHWLGSFICINNTLIQRCMICGKNLMEGHEVTDADIDALEEGRLPSNFPAVRPGSVVELFNNRMRKLAETPDEFMERYPNMINMYCGEEFEGHGKFQEIESPK